MSHSDDKWLVLPPAVAPLHVTIVPFFKTEEELQAIESYLKLTIAWLEWTTLSFPSSILGKRDMPLSWKIDTDDEKSPGWKFNEYELQGVPVRISVGKREMEQWVVELCRRDTGEKSMIAIQDVATEAEKILYTIQKDLLQKNKQFREKNTVKVDTYNAFKQALDEGKFVLAHRDGTAETEAKIKEECQCVTRCIPFDSPEESGVCIYSWKPSKQRVLFARAY